MQSQQAGRFTRLTRSMKYKIFPLINQRFQLFQSDTRQQIDIIVDIRLNWTCRIEKLRYSYPTSAFRCNSLGKIQNSFTLQQEQTVFIHINKEPDSLFLCYFKRFSYHLFYSG